MSKKLYIVRHGETEFNRLGIVQGSGVDSDLNARGQEQALQFYNHYHHFNFDKVYTSALKRTYQSVQRFIEKPLPHEALTGLNEISWGIYEGVKSQPEFHKNYMDVVHAWRRGEIHEKIPQGESPVELQVRQQEALQYILSQPDEEEVLICMHGRALKSFVCLMLGLDLKHMDDFEHRNLCLYILEHQDDRFELIRQNDLAHLS